MPLTSTQIVAQACFEAKCPGFLTSGGIYLNLVLKDLWLHRDLKVNRVTQPLVVQAGTNGPFSLETNYLRTYDLFYLQNNLPYFLHQVTMEQYDMEFKDPSTGNYPYEYATDLSTQAQTASSGAGQLYIYPQSSGQLTLTHRYMLQQPEIATPESSAVVPWFIDQDYLIKATAQRLMGVTDDERAPKYKEDAEGMLRIHLIMEGDEQGVVHAVRLDPRAFRGNRSVRPTKITN